MVDITILCGTTDLKAFRIPGSGILLTEIWQNSLGGDWLVVGKGMHNRGQFVNIVNSIQPSVFRLRYHKLKTDVDARRKENACALASDTYRVKCSEVPKATCHDDFTSSTHCVPYSDCRQINCDAPADGREQCKIDNPLST